MSGQATNQHSSWARPEKTTTCDRECQFCLAQYRFIEVRRYNSRRYCSKQCYTLDQDELDDNDYDDDTDMTAPAAPRPPTKTPITPTLPQPKPQPRPQQSSNVQLKTVQEDSEHIYTWVMDAIDELTTASAELSKAKGGQVAPTKAVPRQPAPGHLTIAAARTFIDMERKVLNKTNNTIKTTRLVLTAVRPRFAARFDLAPHENFRRN